MPAYVSHAFSMRLNTYPEHIAANMSAPPPYQGGEWVGDDLLGRLHWVIVVRVSLVDIG